MSIPTWFDPKAYFDNKLATMNGYNDLTLTAAFNNAGFVGDEGLYAHYLRHGAAEGISPNAYFDVDQYMYAKAQEYFGTHEVNQNQISSMYMAFADAGLTPWEHYQKHGWTEGLAPSNAFDTNLYLAAKLAQLQAEDPDGAWTMTALKQALVDAKLDPLTHYLEHGINEGLGESFLGQGTTGTTQFLSEGKDSLFGTSGNDYFYAGVGELSTNDYIDGGAGTNDTLEALLGLSPDGIAIRPTILNVEKIIFQAQTNSGGGGSNANSTHDDEAHVVSVDAGAIKGMRILQNLDSRADLVVEDVRINSDLMTISWKNADPGLNVDYEVYFNPQNLTPTDVEQSGVLQLKLMDVKNAQNEGNPLTEQPFNSFSFNFQASDGSTTVIKLTFRADDAALYTGETATYATLLTAFQHALADYEAANPQFAGLFEIELGGSFTGVAGTGTSVTDSWESNIGRYIVISTESGTIDAPSGAPNVGWGLPEGGMLPSSGGIAWGVVATEDESCPLIVTTIHLDNVGRVQWDDTSENCIPDNAIFGSEAGDMIVGSMADRGGIERFDVIVESGSWLSSLSSTNNTLRMIEVQAGSKGQLFIGQQYIADNLRDGDPEDDLWGVGSWNYKPFLLSTDGVTDVKQFDATNLDGSANIGARITSATFEKYLDDVDGVKQIDENYAPTHPDYPEGSFVYLFGDKNDILNMGVNSAVAADNDFILNINMGAGNDVVNYFLTNWANRPADETDRQISNSDTLRNVIIDGGAGDDTVMLWGRTAATVNGGEGDDAIYVSQLADGTFAGPSGPIVEQNAVWVFNANSALDRGILLDQDGQPLGNDILSTTASITYTAQTATSSPNTLYLTVTFKGISSTVSVAVTQNATNTGGTISTAALNRAIAAAINDDAVLSKVLLAMDGAGYSLMVQSLIDGEMLVDDLTIGLWTSANGTGDVTWGDQYESAFGTVGNDGTSGSFTPAVTNFVGSTSSTNSQFTVAEENADDFAAPGITQDDPLSITINGVAFTGTATAAITDIDELVAELGALEDADGNTLDSLYTVTGAGNTLTFTFVDWKDNSGAAITVEYDFTAVDGTSTSSAISAPDGVAAHWTLNTGFGNPTEMLGGDYSITIGGQTFTFTLSGALADDAALVARLLAAELDGGTGETLGDFFTVTDNATSTTDGILDFVSLDFDPSITQPTVTATGSVAKTAVDGTANGTASLNHVWGGAGDDVIVLNAASDDDWFDVVEFHNTAAGSEGNDTIFNFDSGADKIDLTSYGINRVSGTYGGATAIDALTGADVLSLVQAGNFFNGSGVTGAQIIQYGADSHEYVLVYVNNTGDAAVAATEITIVGTITLADTLNGADTTLTNADLYVVA